MHASVAHITLKHFGIAYGIAQQRVVRCFGLAQFGYGGYGVRQVHLGRLAVGAFWQFVGNEFAQGVAR